MGSNTHFDPTGEKKARKQATLKGAIICAGFNIVLGAVLAVVMLAITMPAEYKPRPDAQTGKIPPPPAGVFYWAGAPGGDFRGKEDQFLAGAPGGLTVADGELNAWAATMFKSDAGGDNSKPKKTPVAAIPKLTAVNAKKAKEALAATVKVAENSAATWGVEAGTPNFHTFKDPEAPAGDSPSLQIAVPMAITLFGVEFDTIYQARGVFVAGSSGPKFKPYYSFLGNARIPVLPGLAQMVFNSFASKYAGGDDVKKIADAWTKLTGVTVQDGAVVLGGK